MQINDKEAMWVEKWRPQTVEDCILPNRIKDFFQQCVKEDKLEQNLMLFGSPGTGKTTTALALCKQLDYHVKFINASENGNIETLRVLVRKFASRYSLNGKPKVIIFDEADNFNGIHTQPALRGFLEEFSQNCRFIFTANNPNGIIDALKSRCTIFHYNLIEEEKNKCKIAFAHRLIDILDYEKITYEKKDLIDLININYPDNRRILNELQRCCKTGKLIVTGIMTAEATIIEELYEYLKVKNYTKIHKWVTQNNDLEFHILLKALHKYLITKVDDEMVPILILLLNKMDRGNAVCMDKELNICAGLADIMLNITWDKK